MTNDELLLDRIRMSLTERFADVLDAETIERQLADCYQAMLRTARITQFLPVMAENMAIRELVRISASADPATGHAPNVLFLSRHDAGRSQMAVALMGRASLHAPRPVHAESAGVEPTDHIEPVVLAAMNEIGIDLTIDHPKPITVQAIATADLVVRTDESCALPDGKRHLDWDLPDPARLSIADVRQIRDAIDTRVQGLLADLLASA